jgi:hypothetical protein
MAFLPGNNEIFYLDRTAADLRELRKGTYHELPQLAGLGNQPGLAQSSDGRFLAIGRIVSSKAGGLCLWESVSKCVVWLADLGRVDPTSVTFSPDNSTIAVGCRDGEILLCDTRSGRVLDRLIGHRGAVSALAFSTDSRRLASGGADTSILVWDIAQMMARRRHAVMRLKDDEIRNLWARLGSDDAPTGQRALWQLCDVAEQATAFLATEVFIDEQSDKRFQRLMAQLDDESIRKRETAMRELILLGQCNMMRAREALAKAVSSRVRSRLEKVLADYHARVGGNLPYRQARVIQLLECIATQSAFQLLKRIADTHAKPQVREEAHSAIARLRQLSSFTVPN